MCSQAYMAQWANGATGCRALWRSAPFQAEYVRYPSLGFRIWGVSLSQLGMVVACVEKSRSICQYAYSDGTEKHILLCVVRPSVGSAKWINNSLPVRWCAKVHVPKWSFQRFVQLSEGYRDDAHDEGYQRKQTGLVVSNPTPKLSIRNKY